ncbi:hypothetical protein I3679_023340 (plasmid) [Proteus mirabilis]|uniref:Uncharacterized protein n=1 Tax=Proteus mirabilis TaxID=584 RepID=A0ABD5LWQ5_PROMI
MSELVVFKANELAVSRYDLTEHENQIDFCVVWRYSIQQLMILMKINERLHLLISNTHK